MPRTGQLALLAALLLPHVAGARVLYANGGAGLPGAPGPPGPMGPTGTMASNPTITGGTINAATIGGTTPATGAFSTVAATAHMTGTTYQANINVTAAAIGSGVNGPATAQTGLGVTISKDGWYNGTPAVGEVDGLYVTTRQGGVGSDSSGILVDVQNEGKGFLSATEFTSSIVDPVGAVLTRKIDTQSGILNFQSGDYIGQTLTASVGALSTALLIQSNAPSTWGTAIKVSRQGAQTFILSETGNLTTAGKIVAANSFAAGSDAVNGSVEIGVSGTSGTPHLDFYGNGAANTKMARIISDAAGQITFQSGNGGFFSVMPTTLYSTLPLYSTVNLGTGGPVTAASASISGTATAATLQFNGASGPTIATGTVVPLATTTDGVTGHAAGTPAAGSEYVNSTGAAGARVYRYFGAWVPDGSAGTIGTTGATGTNAATAAALSSAVVIVTSTPTGTGVILSLADHLIVNRGAYSLAVYPPSGAHVESLAANAPYTVAAGASARLISTSATQVYAIASAFQ